MSYFVVLHGPLGSGKSTNAEKLARILNAKRFALDEVLSENNLDKLEPNSACIPAANFIKGLEIVIPKARDFLQKGKIVIFDGCFYHYEVLDYLIKNLNFPHYVFTLKAPINVCIDRDKLRPKTLGEDAARAVYTLVSCHNFGIIIDANKSLEETQRAIMSHLPKINN
ncbi:AAA family ATPase [Candidatus Falkowbacteria bacterium]|nr:AAA family ATPase [Candidatus Falkowbacteria bacterium]